MAGDNNMILNVVLVILAAFVLFSLVIYYTNKQATLKSEKFFQMNTVPTDYGTGANAPPGSFSVKNIPVTAPPGGQSAPTAANTQSVQQGNAVMASDSGNNEIFRPVDFTTNKLPNDCFPKDRLTADDLLPKNVLGMSDKWAQVNPAGQGDVQDQNFLTAGANLGINTSSGSLRNASLDLRSEPIIKKDLSQWGPIGISTISPNLLRKQLTIEGEC